MAETSSYVAAAEPLDGLPPAQAHSIYRAASVQRD
jgi:hypothetical protein